MNIDWSAAHFSADEAAIVLDAAADEFDRRAMLPTIAPGAERTRVMACAQWLRDMAHDVRNPE